MFGIGVRACIGLPMASPFTTRHRMRSAVAGVATLSALTGCVVGPDYKAPQMSLTAFHTTASDNHETDRPLLDSWWTDFRDGLLTQTIQEALAQNLDLAASLDRVEQARAAAREAGAQLYPTGQLAAQADSMHQSLRSPIGEIASQLPGYDRNATLYDVGIGASWEADLFGARRRAAQAAGADAQAADADHLAIRISIAAAVADSYLQVRGYQSRLRLTKDQVATDESLLQLVQLRADSGAGTDREIAQARALVLQAQSTIPPLLISLTAQFNRLDVLMGSQPGTYERRLSTPADVPVPPAVTADLTPATLLRRRPDIIAAERRLAASTARIGVAVAQYYPSVSLAGLLGFESLGNNVDARHLLSAESFQPQLVAGLRWRLFDFGRVDAEVARAEGARAESLAQYRQSVLRAAEDVENALTTYVQIEVQEHIVEHEIAALKRVRDTSEEAYKAGAIALTDVLDADRQLLAAQDELVRARVDAARAVVASYRAIGGGWQAPLT
jgi:NodT family efflux transporter outer membrane factor (OMF) lipoprotein